MKQIIWRIRHPLKAIRHWRAMRQWQARFGNFGPAPF